MIAGGDRMKASDPKIRGLVFTTQEPQRAQFNHRSPSKCKRDKEWGRGEVFWNTNPFCQGGFALFVLHKLCSVNSLLWQHCCPWAEEGQAYENVNEGRLETCTLDQADPEITIN